MTPGSRPRFRGVLHQYAFFAALGASVLLVVSAPTARATVAASVYGASLASLFGVSALFHRVTWSVRARRWMGRLDHSTIAFLIAGTFTPIGMLVLSRPLATVLLTAVWVGAAGAVLLHVLWIDA